MTLKSIYDIELKSAIGEPGFLQQFKGKAAIVVNTTVGCGNANQMEVLQWLQEKYGGDQFQIIAIPTNDYCGPGVTYGKWSEGITCGLDSQNYGQDVYGTTFKPIDSAMSLAIVLTASRSICFKTTALLASSAGAANQVLIALARKSAYFA